MPKRKLGTESTSGFFGVNKVPSGKYSVRIMIDRKQKYIGAYDTAKQAAEAYDKEAIKLRKPFSKLNFPRKYLLVIHLYKNHFYPPTPSDIEECTKQVEERSLQQRSELVVKAHTLVHTIQPKKQPLPTIVLFSKPTNPQHY